ncbi:MAG: bifunctional phosphopantothenoylcysteine decarboxylase/phosphopantothenate--cysteine ligase CoaBC [Candidatus Nezhaarchaeota archaeon]|nr:bifunctional phosphopantothenoylcysteine decarboxylase/phosphopantothenate--cysteine ligase CoaBC [Candidatus Nezhaarchaeota archaeon]MCX8142252.1 bifunctional phosphopantothenoylcysteine decarboxylase/phosphopantothenate--cysteine ligase CoaBC [Candidatus Nezhaarchaeota archaeon]MDW8050775.1 bifunctional phosphopantothenoylcysteine decarboxylase/phosphopantothenate--cysteine ligase CoaBC [Nitrososphaerota archaeon]
MYRHTVNEIRCSKTDDLKDMNIALCVTASVAVYKALDLARELIKRGANVRFVATPKTLKFISPTLMQWASGNKPIVKGTGEVEHIAIAGKDGWAHALIVAPATANTLCKLASGISDNVVMDVLTTALGSGKPIIVAPAMHASMYMAPTVKQCLDKLRGLGVTIIEPDVEDGRLKMAAIEDIADLVEDVLNPIEGLRGLKVLVTAGPTREHLDPIRFITNASSGRMGFSLASVCANNGAYVYLISGPTHLKPPRGVNFKSVTSTEEMLNACLEIAEGEKPKIIVLAAAPADFSFKEVSTDKVSSNAHLNVTLKPTPKIYLALRERLPEAIMVGFKAEYGVSVEELLERARRRMKEGNLDIILANDVSRPDVGFGSEHNEGYLITSDEELKVGRVSKRRMARLIMKKAIEILKKRAHKQSSYV